MNQEPSSPCRTILHADMDAFYAAVEQRDDPRLAGKPVIVGGRGPRSVVATASYEARAFGVHSAMPSVEAERRCPHAIFVPPRMEHYAAIGAQVRAIFELFTPLVEPLSLDEAFLDVTGSEALFGDGAAIAKAIRAKVLAETRLRVSVGVASCKFVAKVASDLRKPDALVVVPQGTELEFLAPLPVKVLWGAGKVAQAVFARHGLTTIGAVQQLSCPALVALFGPAMGEHFFLLSRAIDPRAVEPEHAARSISHELTFLPDLTTRAQCERVLLELSELVGARLRAAKLRARVVKLKVRDPDFTTHLRQRVVAVPTCEDLVVYRTARDLLLLERKKMRPVRLLGVGVSDLIASSEPRQGLLFGAGPGDTPPGKGERYLDAVDKIRARFGYDAIRHATSRPRSARPDDEHGPKPP